MELNNYTIAALAVTTFVIILAAAYLSGALDPVIKEVGIMFFKAKAEAEAKKLQAQGMKQGEDFTKGVYFPTLPLFAQKKKRLSRLGRPIAAENGWQRCRLTWWTNTDQLKGNKQATDVAEGFGKMGGGVGGLKVGL